VRHLGICSRCLTAQAPGAWPDHCWRWHPMTSATLIPLVRLDPLPEATSEVGSKALEGDQLQPESTPFPSTEVAAAVRPILGRVPSPRPASS